MYRPPFLLSHAIIVFLQNRRHGVVRDVDTVPRELINKRIVLAPTAAICLEQPILSASSNRESTTRTSRDRAVTELGWCKFKRIPDIFAMFGELGQYLLE